MADIYKFKVSLCELANIIWRNLEITSVYVLKRSIYFFKNKFPSRVFSF